MSGGFRNKPKILRGAFMEYGLSVPPLVVVFQFNPIQLTRNRNINYAPPNDSTVCPPSGEKEKNEQRNSLPEYHKKTDDILEIRDNQQVTIQEESIGLDIRLDATDALNEGDSLAAKFGILPRLATLEKMIQPKTDSLLGNILSDIKSNGFSFTKGPNPPMILFIWGASRVLPVNINSMNITETEFNTLLSPTRATVTVNLTVIEGKNNLYLHSKLMKEAMTALNVASITDVANVVIPG